MQSIVLTFWVQCIRHTANLSICIHSVNMLNMEQCERSAGLFKVNITHEYYNTLKHKYYNY